MSIDTHMDLEVEVDDPALDMEDFDPASDRFNLTPAASLPNSVDAYMLDIKKYPMLTPEQEREAAVRMRDNQDREAEHLLITSNLRYVVSIAKSKKGYNVPLEDLIQEGNIGLMKAVSKFDPDLGIPLIGFAHQWIKAEMHDYIFKNWRIAKVVTTKEQRKLFYNLRRHKKGFEWLNQVQILTIANELNVKPKDVIEMESRMYTHDIGLDAKSKMGRDDSEALSPIDFLASDDTDPFDWYDMTIGAQHRQAAMARALQALDKRSRTVIEDRYMGDEKRTLHESAHDLGVSAERIRQLEVRAIKDLRETMTA